MTCGSLPLDLTSLPRWRKKAIFYSTLASGDTVVLEVTWRGTHTGPLETPTGQVAATGKPIELRARRIVKVAGGKAQSMRQYLDMATLMQQLGVTA